MLVHTYRTLILCCTYHRRFPRDVPLLQSAGSLYPRAASCTWNKTHLSVYFVWSQNDPGLSVEGQQPAYIPMWVWGRGNARLGSPSEQVWTGLQWSHSYPPNCDQTEWQTSRQTWRKRHLYATTFAGGNNVVRVFTSYRTFLQQWREIFLNNC